MKPSTLIGFGLSLMLFGAVLFITGIFLTDTPANTIPTAIDSRSEGSVGLVFDGNDWVIDPNRIKSFTFYDPNGLGHEVVFHESTVLYAEDFIYPNALQGFDVVFTKDGATVDGEPVTVEMPKRLMKFHYTGDPKQFEKENK